MLRLALDAVEGAKAAAAAAGEEEAETDIPGSESTSLAYDSETREYGSTDITAKNQEDDDDIDSHSYDEEDSCSYVSVDPSQEHRGSLVKRCWAGVRGCFTTIANVDSLWDDSEGNISRRNQLVVLFWFFVLATAYAGERSTFYLLVDRTGPFRLFSAAMITASHAVMLGLGMLVSAVSRRNFHFKALGIPIVDVGCTSAVSLLAYLLLFYRG